VAVTFRQLEAFIAVAEAHNFTRASAQLGLAQPIVSGLVRELEGELGFRLFDRTTRKVQLTEAALEFLGDARRLRLDMQDALRRARAVSQRLTGHVKIGAPPLVAAALLPKAIEAFAQSSPGVGVTIVDRSLGAVLDLLRARELDLALGTFVRNEAGIARLAVVSYPFGLVCRNDHPLARLSQPSWSDLKDAPLIALRRGNGIREQIEQAYVSVGLDAKPIFELDQLTTIFSLVTAGFGITVLPMYALSVIPAPSLIARQLIEPSLTRNIDVAHLDDRSLSPAAAEFVRLLRLRPAIANSELPGEERDENTPPR
jgi:DNA-binding transcriptional LysR family regulator